MTQSFISSRARSLAVAVVLASSAALTACSGGSSGGKPPGSSGSAPSGSESAGPGGSPASSQQATTTTLRQRRVSGPNGTIATPVYNPPTEGASGGYYVFPHISRADYEQLGPKVLKQQGVRNIAYLSQARQLEVYFTTDATDSDKQAVYRLVTGQ